MKYLTKLFAATIFFALSNSVYSDQNGDGNKIAEGARLYSENCGRCHNPRPASDYSKKEWSVVMPHMREKGHMTGTEALAVEAFLARTLTSDVRNAQSNAPVNSKLSGEQLVDSFGCQGCHLINGNGGSLGPNLDNVVNSKGAEFVKKKLIDPKFNNSASAMPKFPMTDADIESIIKFLSR